MIRPATAFGVAGMSEECVLDAGRERPAGLVVGSRAGLGGRLAMGIGACTRLLALCLTMALSFMALRAQSTAVITAQPQ